MSEPPASSRPASRPAADSQADLRPHAGDVGASLRQGHLPPRTCPRPAPAWWRAPEALPGRGQPGAGLVADEEAPAQRLLEGVNPRADRGLRYIQTPRRRNETAGLDDFRNVFASAISMGLASLFLHLSTNIIHLTFGKPAVNHARASSPTDRLRRARDGAGYRLRHEQIRLCPAGAEPRSVGAPDGADYTDLSASPPSAKQTSISATLFIVCPSGGQSSSIPSVVREEDQDRTLCAPHRGLKRR